MTDYVVPARRILQTIHIRNPDIPPQHTPTADNRWRAGRQDLTPDSTDGQTICGQDMHVDQLWTPYTPGPGEPICAGCTAGTATFTEEVMF